MKTLAIFCMLLLLLPGLGSAATLAPAGGNWEARDYDALYALLEKYRDEIQSLGMEKASLDEQLKALRGHSDELQKRIDGLLQPKDGMKVHGRVLSAYNDVLALGPGTNLGVTTRYRHAIGKAELEFEAERGPFSALARLDLQNLLGNAFGGNGFRLGMRQVTLELRTPLTVQIGSFWEQMTPLTVWRNEDEFPYESELSRRRRQRLREDLMLRGQAWQLAGLRVSTELASGESRLLSFEGFIAPLGFAGSSVTAASDGSLLTAVYNTYLGGWRLKSPEILGLALAWQSTALFDATDSRAAVYTAANAPEASLVGQPILGFEDQVHSASLSGAWGGLKLGAEAARSIYANPNDPEIYQSNLIGHTGFLTGTAITADLSYQGPQFGMNTGFRMVDGGFRSPASQGRTEDPGNFPMGPMLLENTLYNPQTGQYGGIDVPAAPLAHFNGSLLFPALLTANGQIQSSVLQPYDRDSNPAFPYGASTPNRSGGLLGADFQSAGGAIKLAGDFEMASEMQGMGGRSAEAITVYGAGLWLDLDKAWGWPLGLSAGYRAMDERNSDWLAYSSALVDLGLTIRLAKAAELMFSGRHLDANGTLPYSGADPLLIAKGRVSSQHIIQNAGAGLELQLNDRAQLILSYDGFWYFDPFSKSSAGLDRGWEASQAYARVALSF